MQLSIFDFLSEGESIPKTTVTVFYGKFRYNLVLRFVIECGESLRSYNIFLYKINGNLEHHKVSFKNDMRRKIRQVEQLEMARIHKENNGGIIR